LILIEKLQGLVHNSGKLHGAKLCAQDQEQLDLLV